MVTHETRRDHILHSMQVTTPPLDIPAINKVREQVKDYFNTNDREPEELMEFFNLAAHWQSTRDLMGLHGGVLLGILDVLIELEGTDG